MGHWLGSAAGSQRRRATARSRRGVTFLLLGLISLVASVGAPTAAHGATPGLVAAYSFDAGSGSTAADASGNGNDGTINGATWTTAAKFGNALSFNGASSYVDFGNPTSLRNTGQHDVERVGVRDRDAARRRADHRQVVRWKRGARAGSSRRVLTPGPRRSASPCHPTARRETQRYSTTVRRSTPGTTSPASTTPPRRAAHLRQRTARRRRPARNRSGVAGRSGRRT